jgi:hypothetical protein
MYRDFKEQFEKAQGDNKQVKDFNATLQATITSLQVIQQFPRFLSAC